MHRNFQTWDRMEESPRNVSLTRNGNAMIPVTRKTTMNIENSTNEELGRKNFDGDSDAASSSVCESSQYSSNSSSSRKDLRDNSCESHASTTSLPSIFTAPEVSDDEESSNGMGTETVSTDQERQILLLMLLAQVLVGRS